MCIRDSRIWIEHDPGGGRWTDARQPAGTRDVLGEWAPQSDVFNSVVCVRHVRPIHVVAYVDRERGGRTATGSLNECNQPSTVIASWPTSLASCSSRSSLDGSAKWLPQKAA